MVQRVDGNDGSAVHLFADNAARPAGSGKSLPEGINTQTAVSERGVMTYQTFKITTGGTVMAAPRTPAAGSI